MAATHGEAFGVTVSFYPTSDLLVLGQRIKLDISSSNSARFDVNPNTGDPLRTRRLRVVAHNTIFYDTKRPLHIVLPVIPSPLARQS